MNTHTLIYMHTFTHPHRNTLTHTHTHTLTLSYDRDAFYPALPFLSLMRVLLLPQSIS